MEQTLLDNKEQLSLFTSLDMFTYFFTLSIMFYFISSKVVNVFIIFLWVLIHIFSHKHFYNYFIQLSDKIPQEGRQNLYSILIEFLFIAILITRTIGNLLYTFGYSKLLTKFQNKGEQYAIPKRYRSYETEYKKLYIIGTYLIFLLLALFTIFPTEMFLSTSIDFENHTVMSLINIISVIVLFFFSYLATSNFNSINFTDRIIYSMYVFVLLSISILFVKKGIDYITSVLLQCKIFNESKDANVSNFFTFLTQTIGISSFALLITTTVYEFVYAYNYQKLHSKY